MNLHTPERGHDESFSDYKARRNCSQATAKQIMTDMPRDYSRPKRERPAAKPRNTGQHPKFVKARVHKHKAGVIKPTWPKSIDQKQQSRPLIVIRPVRALRRALLDRTAPDKEGVRVLGTKHQQLIIAASWLRSKRQMDEMVLGLDRFLSYPTT